MALTDPNSVLVRDYLQNVSMLYRNAEYVADQIFPIVDGLNPTAKVGKYLKGPWFRDEAEPRAPGTPARVGEFKITSSNLDPVNYAFASTVPDEERRNANIPSSFPLQPDIDALQYIAEKLDIKKEVRASAVLHATAWGGQAAGGVDAEGHWGDATAGNDTFLADIRTARDSIRSNTGILPNTLFLTWEAWSALQVAPALLALMNPQALSANSLVQVNTLSALIGMTIIIGSAVKNTDEETVADTSFTPVNIWGTSGAETKGVGFIYYKPASVGLRIPSAGYQYRIAQINGQGRMSTTWRDDARHADMYDTQEDTDFSAVGLDLGYMFKDTATT